VETSQSVEQQPQKRGDAREPLQLLGYPGCWLLLPLLYWKASQML